MGLRNWGNAKVREAVTENIYIYKHIPGGLLNIQIITKFFSKTTKNQ